jgi:hypothetical protein
MARFHQGVETESRGQRSWTGCARAGATWVATPAFAPTAADSPGWRGELATDLSDEPAVLRELALRRVRQEPDHELLGLEASGVRSLLQALFGQRRLVIEEVPVRAADETDVRLEDDYPATGGQQLANDGELFDDRIGRLEVLQIVAHEDRSEMRFRKHPAQLQAGRLHEMDIGR